MRTVEIKLYSFDELSEEVQRKVIEKNPEFGIWDNWYEGLFDYYKNSGDIHGFDIEKILFSGFWHQGDGAMFEGSVNKKLFDDLKPNYASEEYKRVIKLITSEHITLWGKFKHYGHYYHHKSYIENLEFEFQNGKNDYPNIQSVLDDIIDSIKTEYEDLCKKIYIDLKKEYEYLMSEEHITSTLKEGDYEFTENGEFY